MTRSVAIEPVEISRRNCVCRNPPQAARQNPCPVLPHRRRRLAHQARRAPRDAKSRPKPLVHRDRRRAHWLSIARPTEQVTALLKLSIGEPSRARRCPSTIRTKEEPVAVRRRREGEEAGSEAEVRRPRPSRRLRRLPPKAPCRGSRGCRRAGRRGARPEAAVEEAAVGAEPRLLPPMRLPPLTADAEAPARPRPKNHHPGPRPPSTRLLRPTRTPRRPPTTRPRVLLAIRPRAPRPGGDRRSPGRREGGFGDLIAWRRALESAPRSRPRDRSLRPHGQALRTLINALADGGGVRVDVVDTRRGVNADVSPPRQGVLARPGTTQLRVGRLVRRTDKACSRSSLYTDDPDRRFTPGATFMLEVPTSSPGTARHSSSPESRRYKRTAVGFFAGVGDRSEAETLVKAILGQTTTRPRSPTSRTPRYDHQLVGSPARPPATASRLARSPWSTSPSRAGPARDRDRRPRGARPVRGRDRPERYVTAGTVTLTPPPGLFEEMSRRGDPEPEADPA